MSVAWLAWLFLPNVAFGQEIWKPQVLLADMFPASTIEARPYALDAAEQASAAESLGYTAATTWTVYLAAHDGHLDGIAVFDSQIGQHEPIDFAVQLSPAGVVVRQEVVVYRERYGSEVRDARFRAQFIGKTGADPLKPGKDVKIVSGATYSSRAMALGVKRAAVIGALFLQSDDVAATK